PQLAAWLVASLHDRRSSVAPPGGAVGRSSASLALPSGARTTMRSAGPPPSGALLLSAGHGWQSTTRVGESAGWSARNAAGLPVSTTRLSCATTASDPSHDP